MIKGKKREKAPITNITNETGNITTDPTDLRRIIREYYKEVIPINLTTYMKQVSSLKNINYQNGLKKK